MGSWAGAQRGCSNGKSDEVMSYSSCDVLGEEALALRSRGCPILGDLQGQVG